jgi:type II secretory pathway pseudopilin PulG
MNPRNRAFTLLETIVATAMLGMVMLMVTQSLDSSTQLNDRTTRIADLNSHANDAINQLSLQLRLAAAGKPTAVPAVPTMQLPGPYPANFTPADPSGVSKVKAYYYTVSTGISGAAAATPWAPTYEPFQRVLIYDYSTDPGRLIMRRFDSAGAIAQETLFSDQVAANGFDISRAGNTVALSLTLRTVNRLREDIIYTAKAQTIFLRSTLSDSSGASPTSFVDEPFDPDKTNDTYVKTQNSPSLLFGNMVTLVDTNKQQVSLLIAAPIGEKLSAKTLTIEIADASGAYKEVAEGATQAVSGCSVMRATQPPPAQWPSPNGTYILTLTGTITGPVNVRVSAQTESGKQCSDYRNYN